MMKRFVLILLTLVALTLLSGCRYRLSITEPDDPVEYTHETPYHQPSTTEPQPQADTSPTPPPEPPQLESPIEPEVSEEQEEYTDEPENYEPPHTPSPYTEAAPDAMSPTNLEIEAEYARQYASYPGNNQNTTTGTQANCDAENTITLDQPGDEGEQAAISQGDDGGIVGVIAVYSTLLRQGVNTLFPCQLFNIYVETPADLVTVARGSDMYQLMVNAGGLNVSSRLGADALTVTADWVVRRDPDIIVKFVDQSILGSNVTNTNAARELRQQITQREGWGAIEAVRNNQVILLSAELLESEESRLAAKLAIARLMYPTLFTDIDADAAIAELLSGLRGIHIYS